MCEASNFETHDQKVFINKNFRDDADRLCVRIPHVWPAFMLLHDLLVISRFKALLKHWTHIISGHLSSVQKLEVRDERRGSTAQLFTFTNFELQSKNDLCCNSRLLSSFPVDPTVRCGWQ